MTDSQKYLKRGVDILLSLIGIIVTSPILAIGIVLSAISTSSCGLFFQKRVGRNGKLFLLIKLRTMKFSRYRNTNVTISNDPRITIIGKYLRKTKIDELPQLFNVLLGTMSFVGPRPDVPGYADLLEGKDRALLDLRPGITGPASLYFHNEEELLTKVTNPEHFNKEIIWPKKVILNLEYLENYSLFTDFNLIFKTLFIRKAQLDDLKELSG